MDTTPAPAKASASVVVIRDGAQTPEVLLIQRNEKIAFHGGAWVFPGGRVDDNDIESPADAELAVAKRAAAREALEETGLVLDVAEMQPFAHWTTPVELPKRFSTWFFIARVHGDVGIEIDNSEIVDYQWMAPAAALRRHVDGVLSLPAPTFVTLFGFRQAKHVQDLISQAALDEIRHFVPRLVKLDDGRCSLYEEDAGYETLDLAAPGPRHRLWMRGTNWDYVREF